MERQEVKEQTAAIMQEIRERIDLLLQEGKSEEVREMLQSNRKFWEGETDFTIMHCMFAICEQEKEEGQQTVYEKINSIEELIGRYRKLMFYLRRFDFDVAGDSMDEFNRFLAKNRVTEQELFGVMFFGTVHKEKVLQIVKDKIIKGELVL